jgi:putative Mg2+ transporter-C (MgtC) family protein
MSWAVLLEAVLKVAVAYLLALPIGWNREKNRRQVGLRTFPLVATASCGYILLGRLAFTDGSAEAQARVLEGLITGMGFIGGGAILKTKQHVRGAATAASIWSTGLIGATVAHGLYALAVVVSAANLLTFLVLTPIAKRLGQQRAERPGEEAAAPRPRQQQPVSP